MFLVQSQASRGAWPTRIADLAALGLPAPLVAWLADVVRLQRLDAAAETRLVHLWIALVADSAAGDLLEPDERAALRGIAPAARTDRELRQLLRRSLAGVSTDSWSVAPAPLTPA